MFVNCPKCGSLFDNTSKWGTLKFCSKSCASSRTWSDDDKYKKSQSAKKSSKVLAENKSRRVLKIELPPDYDINCPITFIKYSNCVICNKYFITELSNKSKTCCKKCFNVYLSTCNKGKTGGFREGAGYSKSGYYKGIYFGSTYELVWAIYRFDHNLEVKRFTGYIEENGKKYFPDFYVDNKIIEIKGRHTKEVDIKTKMAIDAGFNIDVKYKKDLQTEFNWVKSNYTYKELSELYENYKPKYEYTCGYCNTHFNTNKIRKTVIKFCSSKCAVNYRAKIKWNK